MFFAIEIIWLLFADLVHKVNKIRFQVEEEALFWKLFDDWENKIFNLFFKSQKLQQVQEVVSAVPSAVVLVKRQQTVF